jgi:hypothetical protein
MNQKYKYSLLLFCCFIALFCHAQGTINQTFGKNRVQFHRNFDEWQQYEGEHAITYWYGESKNIGMIAAMIADADYEEVQRILDYRLSSKVEIIVYTDLTDLHQSNIGSEELFATMSGGVKIVGEKAFIHFDGNHKHLRRQVREGIAAVFLQNMLFGSNLQEMVQNAISLNLPEWFKQGIVSYIGEDWNSDLDNELRDIVLHKKYKNFEKFATANPRLAGHAFWYFIGQQFGKANVSNLLYLTRINRSAEDGFQYVLGSSYRQTMESCLNYYLKRYEGETKSMHKSETINYIAIKNKRKLPNLAAKISPDGKRVAYVQNEIGKYKIFVQDLQTGKRTQILRGGTRNPFQSTDYNYPILAWNPDNQRLAVIHEKRDIVYLADIEIENITKKQVKTAPIPADLQRIYSADFLSNREIIFSAASRGMSDLFQYNIVNRNVRRLTNDFWDDLDAVVVNVRGQRGILFASNRLTNKLANERIDSILPINSFDIFYKNLEDTSHNLVQVTNTPFADERSPNILDSTYFSYLSNESGIYNRQAAYLTEVFDFAENTHFYKKLNTEIDSLVVRADSSSAALDSVLARLRPDSMIRREYFKTIAITRNLTNLDRNILQQHTSAKTGKTVETILTNGIYQMRVFSMQTDSSLTATPSKHLEYWQRHQQKNKPITSYNNTDTRLKEVKEPNKETKTEKTEKITKIESPRDSVKPKPKYVFQSEFDETPPSVPPQKETTETEKEVEKGTENPETEKPNAADVPQEVAIKEPTTEMALPPIRRFSPDADVRKGYFRPSRTTPYRLRFKTDYVTTTMDNSLLFGGLDSYTGNPQTQQGFNIPPMGFLMKGNFKDLLEDYQLEIGVRIPLTFDGAEYFIVFDDKKKQIDHRYALYHRSRRFSDDDNNNLITLSRQRAQTTLGYYELRYPFDMFSRVQIGATLRNDRFTELATDSTSLKVPNINEQRAGIRLEYVFDNTFDIAKNMKSGTRAKVYAEITKRFQLDYNDKLVFNLNKGSLNVIGFDVRHYERLGKNAIFAVRGAGATTFGQEKILFYMGGLDQQLFGGFDNTVSVPSDNYAFQTVAAQMRGFQQNARNGTAYVLANMELRVAIFRYLSSRPLRRAFWRDFQVVGFFDAGTAWHGFSPFSRDNPLNTVLVANTTVNMTVNYFKDPIVAGYGVGVRLPLLGYFIRGEYAWGIETREVMKPRLHFAIGYDF